MKDDYSKDISYKIFLIHYIEETELYELLCNDVRLGLFQNTSEAKEWGDEVIEQFKRELADSYSKKNLEDKAP